MFASKKISPQRTVHPTRKAAEYKRRRRRRPSPSEEESNRSRRSQWQWQTSSFSSSSAAADASGEGVTPKEVAAVGDAVVSPPSSVVEIVAGVGGGEVWKVVLPVEEDAAKMEPAPLVLHYYFYVAKHGNWGGRGRLWVRYFCVCLVGGGFKVSNTRSSSRLIRLASTDGYQTSNMNNHLCTRKFVRETDPGRAGHQATHANPI